MFYKQKIRTHRLWRWSSDYSCLVEVTGLEPAASCSQSRRATNCATPRYLLFYRAGRIFPNHPRYQLRHTRLLNFFVLLSVVISVVEANFGSKSAFQWNTASARVPRLSGLRLLLWWIDGAAFQMLRPTNWAAPGSFISLAFLEISEEFAVHRRVVSCINLFWGPCFSLFYISIIYFKKDCKYSFEYGKMIFKEVKQHEDEEKAKSDSSDGTLFTVVGPGPRRDERSLERAAPRGDTVGNWLW